MGFALVGYDKQTERVAMHMDLTKDEADTVFSATGYGGGGDFPATREQIASIMPEHYDWMTIWDLDWFLENFSEEEE